MPTENLRPENRGTRCIVSTIEQRLETSGVWRGVVVQQPHPVDDIWICLGKAHPIQASSHGFAKSGVRRECDDSVRPQRGAQQFPTGIR